MFDYNEEDWRALRSAKKKGAPFFLKEPLTKEEQQAVNKAHWHGIVGLAMLILFFALLGWATSEEGQKTMQNFLARIFG